MITIPISNDPNQTFSVIIPLGSVNLDLEFYVFWNPFADYWQMTVRRDGVAVIDGLPLITGKGLAGNLLEQYEYLGIGSAYVVPLAAGLDRDFPGENDWGSNFIMLWGE